MTPLLAVALFLDVQAPCAAPPPPPPVCVQVSKLQKVCGYQCVRDGKSVFCTQTPDGFCYRQGGHAACYDPPEDVRWLLQDPEQEKPACMVSLREIACGYHCLKHVDGRVRCALTPLGACHSNQGAIGCWDPPDEVRWRMLQAQKLEPAQCISLLEHIECGFHCTAVGSNFACAASPWGECRTHFTEVSCSDPQFAEATR